MYEIDILVKLANESDNAAEFWHNVKNFFSENWKPIVGVALGIAIPAIGNYYLQRSIHELITEKGFKEPKTNEIIDKVKVKAGLTDIPHKTFELLNNAFYIPPRSIPESQVGYIKEQARNYMLSKNKLDKEHGKILNTIVDFSNSTKGGIIVGKKLTNPYVIAHELGHAKIHHDGGIYGFMQKYGPWIQNIGKLMMIGSLIPRLATPSDSKWHTLGNIMLGVGAGALGTGLISELLYENKASQISKELLEKQKMREKARALGQELLNKSYLTYVTKSLGTVLPPIGGLTGYYLT